MMQDCEWCQIFVSVHSKYIHYEMVIEVYKDQNVMVDWIFHLWDEEDALSANSFTIVLGTEETAQMEEYLESIVR